MITIPAWRGKRFAVLGLARSGAATVRALLASGAGVLAWDSDEAKRLELVQAPPVQGRGWGGGLSTSTVARGSHAPHPAPLP